MMDNAVKYTTLIFLYSLLCQLFIGLTPLQATAAEKPIAVVIVSYKNAKFHAWNLESILTQDYSNYRVIYVDDCSPDGTADLVEKYVLENYPQANFTLVRNQARVGAMANLYHAIHSCQDKEIVATVDGDDALYHPHVLKQLNEVYSANEVWFSHGCLMEYPMGNVTWCEPIPPHIIAQSAFREFKCPSHLRTFYAWIFKKIKREDFMDEQGKWLAMAWDMAIMYPIAEMAGERHAYIAEANYLYNMANPINDNKVDPDLQNQLDKLIRNRPRYQRLEKADVDL